MIQKTSNKKRFSFSLFWKYFLMMGTFTLLLVLYFFIYKAKMEEILIEKNLTRLETDLTSDGDELAKKLVLTAEVPWLIESSSSYSYIRGIAGDSLPVKYYPAGTRLRELMIKQLANSVKYEEAALYLPNVDTVVSKLHSICLAEDYFDGKMTVETVNGGWIREKIRGDKGQYVFPVQNVNLGEFYGNRRGMVLIYHPSNASTSLLLVIPEQELLKQLGFTGLPEGSVLKLYNGRTLLLETGSDEKEARPEDEFYSFSEDLSFMKLHMDVRVPKDYFSTLLEPYLQNYLAVCGLFLALAVLMSLFFSSVSVRPIKELIRRTSRGKTDSVPAGNELHSLADIIDSAHKERTRLQDELIRSQLDRLFFGGMLNEGELDHLSRDLDLDAGYRIALIKTPKEEDPQPLLHYLEVKLPQIKAITVLDNRQFGLLLPEDPAALGFLQELPEDPDFLKMDYQKTPRIGIGSGFDNIREFHTALSQAGFALPDTGGTAVFDDSPKKETGLSGSFDWVTHEQIYQAVLSCRIEEVLSVLKKAYNTESDYAPLQYANLAYVLLCAANEVGIPVEKLSISEYDPKLNPDGNLRVLERHARKILSYMAEKKEMGKERDKEDILQYIRYSYPDKALCATLAAEALGLREKDVIDKVKEATGLGFGEYLTSLRFQKVMELMKDPQRSSLEIAEQCGFGGESTFYRLFKQRFGTTPARYRRDLLRTGNSDPRGSGKQP